MAVAILTAAGSGASAQTVDVGDLRRCAALDTNEQKLACFERLADIDTDAPAAASGEPASGDDGPAGSPAETPAAVEEPAPPASTPAPPAEPAPDTGPIRALAPGVEVDPYPGPQQPDVEAAQSPEPAAESATATEPGDDFGRRYVEQPADDGPDAVTATVNEVSQGRHKVLYFHFANGQLWRQMEPGRFPYPKDGSFEVEIRQGMMGDFQMRVGGEGRMTRIVRVR